MNTHACTPPLIAGLARSRHLLLAAFVRMLCVLSCGSGLWAAAGAAAGGTVVGTVFDARTNQNLAGARISIAGTDLVVTTDLDGRFRFSEVPLGPRTIVVSYLGAERSDQTIEVTAQSAREIAIGVRTDVVKMGKFVVSSYAGPQMQALNEQRQNDRLSDIVSADSVGNMPDSDLRSALNRLPGVNVTGETGTISIRGAEGKLNAVVMDGGSISQAAQRLDGNGDTGRTRATDLQTIPAESAQSIEVIKTLTPDLDATAVGGIVNIRTGSAFSSRQRILNFTPTHLWWDQGGSGEQFQFFFRDTLNPQRTLGAMVNISYKHFDRVYSQNEYRYANEAAAVTDAAPLLNANDVRRNEETVEQFMLSGSLDWKLSATTTLAFKPFYTWRKKDEFRKRVNVQLDNVVLTAPDGSAARGTGARVAKTNRFRPDRATDQARFAFNGETQLAHGRLDYVAGYSRATARATNYESTYAYPTANAVRNNLAWTLDRSTANFPVFAITTAGVAGVPNGTNVFTDDARYEWGAMNAQHLDNLTTDLEAKIDWTRRFTFSRPLTLKAGVKWRESSRTQRQVSLTWTGPNNGPLPIPAGTVPLEAFSSFDGRYSYMGGVQNMPVLINYFKTNPQQFTFSQTAAVNASANLFHDIVEDTSAGYAMGTLDLTRTVRVLGGVRAEYFTGEYDWTPSRMPAYVRGTFNIRDVSRQKSYLDLFPSAAFVYRPDDRKVVRLGYSTSIARPDYTDVVPRDNRLLQSFVDPDSLAAGNWTVGNPALKPARSSNLDLSAQWYYGRGNYISAAVFRKEMKEFIFSASHPTEIQITDRLGAPTFNANRLPQYVVISRRENGGKQELQGYELSWQHRFSGLPAPFDGFGAGLNYSNVRGTQDRQLYADPKDPFRITGFIRDPRTQDQAREVLSSQLYWEKSGFEVRGSYTWTGEQVFIFDEAGQSDRLRAPLSFLDASFAYNFWKGWKVFLTVRNLTKRYEDYRYYERRTFVRNYDEDGRSWTLGLRAAF
ncbi:MAG: TonB-dependent receptor [Opitutus sp.]|nr:TonB-dependent receptor [Opitutus sp.]